MYRSKKIVFAFTCFSLLAILAYVMVWQSNASTEMPVLYLMIDDGEPLVEKEYSTASMEISYPNQVGEQTFSLSIRQRGNSTMNYEKKAFKIKLDEKADLLLGGSESSDNAATDWILLANCVDTAGLRTYFTFFAASMLDGLEYVSESIFVEVYLNGEYQGVYQLCEEVEIDEARLDLDDKMEGDNAVLLEYVQAIDTEYYIGAYYGDEGMIYEIHSTIASDEQVFRAFSCVYAANEAIISGDQAAIEAAIDIESCVDMYLLQEFVMNIDVGYSSFYLYLKEDDSTVYFGPPWDFDRSLGSVPRCENYAFLYAASDVDEENGVEWKNQWYYDLMQYEWFQQMVQDRWNEKKDIFLQALVEIQQTEALYHTQLEANYALWYAAEDQSQEEWQDAYETNYDELYEWIENRYIWLDNYFNEMV